MGGSAFAFAVFFCGKLGAAAFFGLCAWVFGETTLRRFGWPAAERSAALSMALGMGLLAEGLLVLGFAGGFRPWAVLTFLGFGQVLCWRTWADLVTRLRVRFGGTSALGRVGLRFLSAWWVVLLCLAPIVWLGLYPPTGWDATAYHLPFVRAFLEAGSPVFVDYLRYPVFPQAAETLFLAATVLGGDVAAKLTSTLSLLLVAALLAEWGSLTFSPRVGRWAAALWLGTPLAVWLGTLAYVDVQLTLFVVAGFFCWQRWRDGVASQPAIRWLALAGFFVGLAAGTKYLGLFFCGVLGVLTLGRSLRLRRLSPVLAFTLVAVLAMSPWYGRIVWFTGNPVFPFYAPFFGSSDWTTRHDLVVFGEPGSEASGSEASGEDTSGGDASGGDASGGDLMKPSRGSAQLGRLVGGLGLLVRLPWSGVFERAQFFSVAPLSPWYLVLLPLALPLILFMTGPAGRSVRRIVACVGLYSLFWLTIEHDLRFLLPAMPLLDLALVAGLDRLGRLLRSPRAAIVVGALLFAPGWLYAGYKISEKGPLPVTAQARADFLEAHIKGYAGLRWLNEKYGSDYVVYGLETGRLRHYADGLLLGDAWGPAGYQRLRQSMTSSAALEAELRRLGAGFLLVDRRRARDALPSDPGFERRFRSVWRRGGYEIFELRAEPAKSRG